LNDTGKYWRHQNVIKQYYVLKCIAYATFSLNQTRTQVKIENDTKSREFRRGNVFLYRV